MKTFKSFTSLLLAIIITGSCFFAAFAAGALKAPKLTSVKNAYNGVCVKWNKVEGAESYKIYAKSSKSFKQVGSVKDTNIFIHKGTKSKRVYTYKVKAFNSESSSAFSNKKSVYRVKTPKLKISNASKGVKASWSKIKGATKYTLLYKKAGAKKFKTSYSGKKLKFTDDNLNSGSSYVFKVKAKIKKKSSAYSKASEITYLERPELRQAEELIDMNGIQLRWSAVKGADGYHIYRSLKYKNAYKRILSVNSAITAHMDKTVKNEKNPTQINSYKYYIKAYKGKYTSAKSKVKSDVYGWIDKSNLSKDPLYLTINKGQVYKDIHKKLSDNYILYLFTWKSSNKKTVKVDNTGVLTGVKKGKATITANALVKNSEVKIRIIVTVK